MADLQKTFKEETTKKLMETLKLKNPMAVPRLKKITLNSSSRDFLLDKSNLEKALEDLSTITGQKAKIAKAKVSIASFKLREGDKVGIVVTLRGARMYDFFEKLVKVVFPRMRDFAGIDPKAFDGQGNFSIGFSENTVFPEIDPGKVDKIRSLQVTITTNARTDEQGRALFEALGVPFRK